MPGSSVYGSKDQVTTSNYLPKRDFQSDPDLSGRDLKIAASVAANRSVLLYRESIRTWQGLSPHLGVLKVFAVNALQSEAHDIREKITTAAVDTSEMKELTREDITILVRPLDTGINPRHLRQELMRAFTEKEIDDHQSYGELLKKAGYSSLKEWSIDARYYKSPSHLIWAEAAEARTGGVIPSEFWLEFDPFGGTAGAGPKIMPQGQWPGVLAAIAFAHDTDWSLGRYFGVGPFACLRGAEGSASDLGIVGLVPAELIGDRFKDVPLYTDGMRDWVVKQSER